MTGLRDAIGIVAAITAVCLRQDESTHSHKGGLNEVAVGNYMPHAPQLLHCSPICMYLDEILGHLSK